MKKRDLLLLFYFGLTWSISAQDIRVYFNQSVDHNASLFTDAQTSAHLDDTLCKYIDLANYTLDIAVWDNGNDHIVDCINSAYERGVQVRYITSSNASNSALSGLNSGIPVLERNAGVTSNVMHNKFVIIDQTWLLTGSMNFNDGAIFNDYNNLVLIYNPAMCGNYTTEFQEMWGSTGPMYNTATSKFGPDKTDNTLHSLSVGGVTVESYFSPTDQTTSHIIEAIDAADYTLDIALFTFINNDLSDAVIAAHDRGVLVRCIIENSGYIGSEYNNLLSAGIEVFSHAGEPYDFHHKYCIIDAKHTDSDPVVVTGSHNWTNSAEDEYDENTLIIHDPLIAWQYTEEFSQRWQDLGGTLQSSLPPVVDSWKLIKTGQHEIQIQTSEKVLFDLVVFTTDGKLVLSRSNSSPNEPIDLPLGSGIYFVTLVEQNTSRTFKLTL